jgi:hypothetical protein
VNEYFETTLKGVFAVGNLLTPFDYVDDAVDTAFVAAEGVSKHLNGEARRDKPIPLRPGPGVKLLVPHRVEWGSGDDITLFLRPSVESENARITVKGSDGRLHQARRRYVRPSLMERVELPRSFVEHSPDGVVVDVD